MLIANVCVFTIAVNIRNISSFESSKGAESIDQGVALGFLEMFDQSPPAGGRNQ